MRIAIVDQSPVFRLGLKSVIQRFLPGTEFLETNSAFSLNESTRVPQIIFLSLDEIEYGQTEIKEVHQRFAQSILIGTTSNTSDDALWADWKSVVLADIMVKTAPLERVTATCARAVINLPSADNPKKHPHERLTAESSSIRLPPRHLETLKHLTDGRSNQQIADHMSISVNTVRIYVSAILKSLNASNRTQAALIGREILKYSSTTIN